MANNIPQGYKQTELGIIPEDWEVKSFSQIFDMYPNNTYPRDCMNETNGYVQNIHYGDILVKYPSLVDVSKYKVPYLNENINLKTSKYLQSGDVIIADTAEDDAVGRCIEVKNITTEKIVSGLHTFFCHPIIPFASGWLGYYMNSSNYHNQLLPFITGIKVSSISKASILETKILLPPLPEQKAIAEALSDVDELITALDKKIAKKRLIKQGTMQELLTGKKRLPGFTDEWVEKKVKDIFKVTRGYVLSTNKTVERPDGYYKYPVYSSQTQNNGIMGYYSEYLFNEAITWTTDGANAGEVNLRRGKFYCTNVCGVLINEEGYSNDCIASIINMVAKSHVSYIGNPKLMNNVMAEINICIPSSIEEQQAIATILSDMDKEIADLEAQRDKYRLVKSGMMQKLLTGEIRLKKE